MTLKISVGANRTFRIGSGYYQLSDSVKMYVNIRGDETAPFPLKNDECIDAEDAKGPYSLLWLAVQKRLSDPSSITAADVSKVLGNLKESEAPKLEGLAEIEELLAAPRLHIRAFIAARELAIQSGEIDKRYEPVDPFEIWT